MHSGGLELTQLTYSRHEDNLLYRGDRVCHYTAPGYYGEAQYSGPIMYPKNPYIPLFFTHQIRS